MVDRLPRPPASGPPDETFDREIGIGGITRFLVVLTAGCVIVGVAMFGLYKFFQARETAKDKPPSPLVDRSVPRLPPEPRLQAAPEAELAAMRAEEQAILTSFGWVDEKAGVARIPIDAAMDLLLQRGLPARAAAPAPIVPISGWTPVPAHTPATSSGTKSEHDQHPTPQRTPGGGH